MRESLSLNPYNRKFLFIEYKPFFSRYDIVERIKSYAKVLLHIEQIGIIYFKKNKYILEIISKNKSLTYKGNIYELINKFLKNCNIPIVLFSEEGYYNLNHVLDAKCYISGLHTDIPYTIAEHIRRNYEILEIALSKINYLASQVLIITDMHLRNHNIFYLLPKQ